MRTYENFITNFNADLKLTKAIVKFLNETYEEETASYKYTYGEGYWIFFGKNPIIPVSFSGFSNFIKVNKKTSIPIIILIDKVKFYKVKLIGINFFDTLWTKYPELFEYLKKVFDMDIIAKELVIEDIDKYIKELTPEKFELFTATKKYNL